MPRRDDVLKKYQEAGADFVEVARSRAEEFLRELAKAGDSTQSRAQGAFDELVEGSRRGTEQILELVRREITSQLSLLGIATKGDLAKLERKLGTGGTATRGMAKKTAPPKKAAPAKKTAPAKKSSPAKKAAATRSAAAKRT
jgi:polyhydroxyalkanoate synthesis regulator phasin